MSMGVVPAAQELPGGTVEDELLGARHRAPPHGHVPGMTVRFGPMGLDVPINEDGEGIVTGVPGPDIGSGKGLCQGCADRQNSFAGKISGYEW